MHILLERSRVFIGLGYYHPVYKNNPEFLTDSLFGLQANCFITPKIKTHIQGLLRDLKGYDLDDFIHYAYFYFQITPDLSFRIGRNPLDIFLLSDYRNVGFAYPWIRPVTGMYSTLFSDFYEGVQLNYSKRMPFGRLSLKAYTGMSLWFKWIGYHSVIPL